MVIVITRVRVGFVHREVKTHSLVQSYECYYSRPCSVFSSHSCKPFVVTHVHIVFLHRFTLLEINVFYSQHSINIVVVRTVYFTFLLLRRIHILWVLLSFSFTTMTTAIFYSVFFLVKIWRQKSPRSAAVTIPNEACPSPLTGCLSHPHFLPNFLPSLPLFSPPLSSLSLALSLPL